MYEKQTHDQMINIELGEFPGGPVVRTQRFHCRSPGSIPGQGTKTLQAVQRGQKQTNKQTKELGQNQAIKHLS